MDCGFFKEINGFPGYYINIYGVVYNSKTDKILKQWFNKGYACVHLYKYNKDYKQGVHRLLGLHFLERVEGCDYIDHIDRDRKNNSLNNLRWVTKRGNEQNGQPIKTWT